jgi:hypothetical protein
MENEKQTQAAPKRPKLVWFFSAGYFVSAAWTITCFALVFSGKVQLTPLLREYLSRLSAFDYIITAVIVGGNLSGATALFRLRRAAFPLFAVTLAFSLVTTIFQAMTSGLLVALGTSGIAGTVIGWIFGVIVCLYTRKKIKEGLLK